jgi:hypothetical protein
MVKTLPEFRDELRTLRDEMFQNAETADLKLVASWVDRLAMALEELSVTLELTSQEVETVSEAEAGPCVCSCCEPCPPPRKKAKPAKRKKPAKKKRR